MQFARYVVYGPGVDIIPVVSSLHPAIQWIVAGITLTAAFTDLRSRIIPNWLVVTGLASGFVLNILLAGWTGLSQSCLGFGLALLIYVPLFILRAMGGGDVKLMAAVGSLVGPQNWFLIFLLASIAGGLYALVLLFARNVYGGVFRNVIHILGELVRLRLPFRTRPELDVAHERAVSVPHAVAILAGAVAFLYGI